MPDNQDGSDSAPFTEALLTLYGLAGKPAVVRVASRTEVPVTTIDGWLKEGLTPRNRDQVLTVVAHLHDVAKRHNVAVPGEMGHPHFWTNVLKEQAAHRTSKPVVAVPRVEGAGAATTAGSADSRTGQPAPHRPRIAGKWITTGLAVVLLSAGVSAYWLVQRWEGDNKSADAGAAPKKDQPVPLVFVNDGKSWQCGDAVVVPRTVGAAGIAPGSRPSDGVAASSTRLGFTVQGMDGQTVTLLDIKVDVLKKEAPLRGTRVPVVCQGDPPNRNLTADLDLKSPYAHKAPAREGDGGSSSDTGWPYTVSGSDPEHFVVSPTTRRHDVTFTLLLQWAWNGRRGQIRIDDQGKPFRVTSDRNAIQLCLDRTTTRLLPQPKGKTCAS
ncbi:hypothetical protein [Streptomyces hawaiiensis]|uniref:hypothetical protein n=1 Tax=Streptomyces hawaiiensis TaxID=67305 RepID=UPI001586742E|nr:hypothetical protein [Streptomyces hawaiiensis]